MTQFDMSSAWNDAVVLLRADAALTSALAGALVMLPALAFALIGPVPAEPPVGADWSQIMEITRAELSRMAPLILLMSLLGWIAGLAIMRLWLAPTGISVSEALTFALGLLPGLILLFIIQMAGLTLAAFAFIVPAFYLAGRWAAVLPTLAAGETRSPVQALMISWAITRGNGWRIALMLVLVQLVIFIVSLLVEGISGAFGARGSIGFALASVINSTVTAAAALVGFAVSAAVYRQLSQAGMARNFE